MILRISALKFFKYLIRRRFFLRRKSFFFKKKFFFDERNVENERF